MHWMLWIVLALPLVAALLFVIALATGLIHEPARTRDVARALHASWQSLHRP